MFTHLNKQNICSVKVNLSYSINAVKICQNKPLKKHEAQSIVAQWIGFQIPIFLSQLKQKLEFSNGFIISSYTLECSCNENAAVNYFETSYLW